MIHPFIHSFISIDLFYCSLFNVHVHKLYFSSSDPFPCSIRPDSGSVFSEAVDEGEGISESWSRTCPVRPVFNRRRRRCHPIVLYPFTCRKWSVDFTRGGSRTLTSRLSVVATPSLSSHPTSLSASGSTGNLKSVNPFWSLSKLKLKLTHDFQVLKFFLRVRPDGNDTWGIDVRSSSPVICSRSIMWGFLWCTHQHHAFHHLIQAELYVRMKIVFQDTLTLTICRTFEPKVESGSLLESIPRPFLLRVKSIMI